MRKNTLIILIVAIIATIVLVGVIGIKPISGQPPEETETHAQIESNTPSSAELPTNAEQPGVDDHESNAPHIGEEKNDPSLSTKREIVSPTSQIATPTATPVHEHTPVEDAAVEPTCQQTGLTRGSHCSICGEVLLAQTEIPIADHHYENGVCIWCGKQEEQSNPPTGGTDLPWREVKLG